MDDPIDDGRGSEDGNASDDQDGNSTDGSVTDDQDIDHGDVFHQLFRLIVHRYELVWDAYVVGYMAKSWTHRSKPAPFPFNLDATWYCGLLIALILAIHVEIDAQWLLRKGYLHLALRALSNAFITFALSVFSTLAYEIFGNLIDIGREVLVRALRWWTSRAFIVNYGWGEVLPDGEPALDDQGNFQWNADPTNLREPIRNAVLGLVSVCLNYFFIFIMAIIYGLCQLAWGRIFIPVLAFIWPEATGLILSLPSILTLPTQDQNITVDSVVPIWEYGIQVTIQLGMSVFLWLLTFLLMAKSEWLAMVGQGRYDPRFMLLFHLTRATAMHLLAYTAYQIACIAVFKLNYSNNSVLYDMDPSISEQIGPGAASHQGDTAAAVLLLIIHWILQNMCSLWVRFALPYWSPIIVWLSKKTDWGARTTWDVWLDFMENDFQILDINTRVFPRVIMTALFGLRSSWPARFRLSTVVDDARI